MFQCSIEKGDNLLSRRNNLDIMDRCKNQSIAWGKIIDPSPGLIHHAFPKKDTSAKKR